MFFPAVPRGVLLSRLRSAIYVKGDMYIRDMKNTAGHVGELTSGAWHPKDSQTFITSASDSTIRCVVALTIAQYPNMIE